MLYKHIYLCKLGYRCLFCVSLFNADLIEPQNHLNRRCNILIVTHILTSVCSVPNRMWAWLFADKSYTSGYCLQQNYPMQYTERIFFDKDNWIWSWQWHHFSRCIFKRMKIILFAMGIMCRQLGNELKPWIILRLQFWGWNKRLASVRNGFLAKPMSRTCICNNFDDSITEYYTYNKYNRHDRMAFMQKYANNLFPVVTYSIFFSLSPWYFRSSCCWFTRIP